MENVRKCEKCGADIDVNDMFCPECGVEQPIRFHYEAYETSRFDRIIGGDYDLKRINWLKEISYENGILALSNQENKVWSAPIGAYEKLTVMADKDSGKVFSIDGSLKADSFAIKVGGDDLYPQDWEHITLSLQKLGIPLQLGECIVKGKGALRFCLIWGLFACILAGILLLIGD